MPNLRGLHTHERALAEGLAEHGCTVHLVTAEIDAGPILAQARVPVLPGDDAGALAARVLKEEHRIYPQALEAVARSLRVARQPQEPDQLNWPRDRLLGRSFSSVHDRVFSTG